MLEEEDVVPDNEFYPTLRYCTRIWLRRLIFVFAYPLRLVSRPYKRKHISNTIYQAEQVIAAQCNKMATEWNVLFKHRYKIPPNEFILGTPKSELEKKRGNTRIMPLRINYYDAVEYKALFKNTFEIINEIPDCINAYYYFIHGQESLEKHHDTEFGQVRLYFPVFSFPYPDNDSYIEMGASKKRTRLNHLRPVIIDPTEEHSIWNALDCGVLLLVLDLYQPMPLFWGWYNKLVVRLLRPSLYFDALYFFSKGDIKLNFKHYKGFLGF